MIITEFMRRAPLLSAALFCFASFGWGMSRHFRKVGPRPVRLRITGLSGMLFAVWTVGALAVRPLGFPVTAFVLYGLSGGLFWLAVRATRGKGFAACFQGVVTPELVTSGCYFYIRHPFYTAYEVCWVAGFVATGWWPLGAAAAAEILLYYTAAREEERELLASRLGPQYSLYMTMAGRFVPRLRAGKSRAQTRPMRSISDRNPA